MGAFDDLIPEGASSAPGAFDDLIPAAPEVGAVEGGMRAMGRGVPVAGSFLDEIRAAVRAGDTTLNKAIEPYIPEAVKNATPDFVKGRLANVPGETFAERYGNAVTEERAKDKAYDKANPILSPALQIAGGVAATSGLISGAPAVAKTVLGMGGKTMAGKVAASAASGAALGGVHGFGSGEGDIESRVTEGEKGALVGGLIGAASPVVSAAVGKVANAFTKVAAPTLEKIKTQAKRLYDQADNVGLVVSKGSLQNLGQDVQSALAQEGFHPKIHPKVAAAIDEIGKAGDADQPLQMIQNLRRIAQSAGKSIEPDERRIGGVLVEKLDDYLENLKATDVLAGDAQQASTILKQARTLWSRVRKAETIEGMIERADIKTSNFSGSGAENAIRREFVSLASNAKKMRTFTPAEQEAIKRVAKGGPLANSLRFLGKLAPTGVVSTYLGGGIGGSIGATVGGVLGGPIGAAVGAPVGATSALGLGGVARNAATAVTRRSAQSASEIMRGGSSALTPVAKTLADYAQGAAQGALPTLSQRTKDIPEELGQVYNHLSMP